MKNKKWSRASLFVCVVVLGLLLATAAVASSPPEQGGKGQDQNQPVSSGPIPETQAKVWTEEEMLSAIPAPLPFVPETAEADLLGEPVAGPLELVPGGIPAESKQSSFEAADDLETDYLDALSLAGVEPLGYSYPFPFTRFEIFTTYQQYPYMTIGKVFFTGTDGIRYVCSGASAVGRAFWTAGHCVYNSKSVPGPDGWNRNVSFVPARKDGNNPYGQWTAKQLWTLTGWTNDGNVAYDIGMVVTNDIGGWKLSQRVGYLGAMWNASRVQHWNAFGYPAKSPFNGERLFVCQASHAADDSKPGPDPIGIGCDMTGGSSGGPWIVKFDGRAGPYNYANGVNSYAKGGQPNSMYSPYFSDGAKNLYDTVKNK